MDTTRHTGSVLQCSSGVGRGHPHTTQVDLNTISGKADDIIHPFHGAVGHGVSWGCTAMTLAQERSMGRLP